ncbi:hypothetical protein CKK34_1279 [Yarrowia sp. E02]|nr:hypothetical protein CKK34_1279 [Yarrowia sp. E02]
MLPPEVVCDVAEYLDLEDLVALGLSSSFWNQGIPDSVYRVALHKRCPFYELENSPRDSWKECARVHVLRVSPNPDHWRPYMHFNRHQVSPGIFNANGNGIPYEFCQANNNTISSFKDVCLQEGFEPLVDPYGIVQHRGTTLSQSTGTSVVVMKDDHNFEGVKLCLGDNKQPPTRSALPEKRISFIKRGTVVEDHDHIISSDVDVACTIFSSFSDNSKRYFGELNFKNIVVPFTLAYSMDQGRIKVKLFEASGKLYVTIRQLVFHKIDIYTINDARNVVTYNSTWSPEETHDEIITQRFMWYDGCVIKWSFCGKSLGQASKRLQFSTYDMREEEISTFFNCIRDDVHDLFPHPKYPRYVMIFTKGRQLTGVWDLKSRSFSVVKEQGSFNSDIAISFPGLLNGKLGFWAYSDSYMAKLTKEQTDLDCEWIDTAFSLASYTDNHPAQTIANDIYTSVGVDEVLHDRILDKAPWWCEEDLFAEQVKQRLARMTGEDLLPWFSMEYEEDHVIDLGIGIVRHIFYKEHIDIALQASFSKLIHVAKERGSTRELLTVVHLVIDQGSKTIAQDENVKMANYIFQILSRPHV